MMLAYTTLINENYHCDLNWYPSLKECLLNLYLHQSNERPQLPILQHPDYESIQIRLNGDNYCVQYVCQYKTAGI